MRYAVELVVAKKITVEVIADNYIEAYNMACETVEDDALYIEPYDETEYI